jgi:hypothetical protein
VLVEDDALIDYALYSAHHGSEAHLHVAQADAELGSSAGVVGDLGGSDQSLGGDAPPRDSGAADEARPEQRHPPAPGAAHAHPAAHPAADQRDVEATHARR